MRRFVVVSLAVLICLVLPAAALADMGPNPTTRIKLVRNGQRFSGDGLQYQVLNCTAGSGNIGSQESELSGLAQRDLSGCVPSRCSFTVYSAAENRIWPGNPAELTTLYAIFTFDLRDDGTGLLVLRQGNVLERARHLPSVLPALLYLLIARQRFGWALLLSPAANTQRFTIGLLLH
ncbi:MAG: hypothetical protein ACYC6L_09490 [Anaerolineae bacterium]